MNICLVTPERPPFAGGIATYTASLARILMNAGHSVVILCTDATPPQNSAVADGLRMVELVEPRRAWQRQVAVAFSGRARDSHQSLAAGLAVRDWLLANAERESIAVVEVPDFQGVGAFLGDLSLPACVVAGHGTIGQIGCFSGVAGNVSSQFVSTLESIALGCSDAVVCHSHSYRRELATWAGRDVLFSSAPFQFVKSQRAIERLRDDFKEGIRKPLRLIVLGRLQPLKGPEVLCAAIRIVRRTLDVTVDWYGRSVHTAAGNRDMKRHISETYPDLWGTVFRWHPPLTKEQAMIAVANADALVVASLWETFGYTAIEAVSLGTPVIISDTAGASYLFQNNGAGIVFQSGDARELAHAIHAMADGNARAQMCCKALKVIETELAPEKVAAERIASYEVAIAQKAARRQSPYFPGGIGAVIDRLCSGSNQAEVRDVSTMGVAELLGVVGSRVKRRISRAIWRSH